MGSVQSVAGRAGPTSPDPAACRGRRLHYRDRPTGRSLAADGHRLPASVAHRGLDGLPDRPRPGRPQTVRRVRRTEILQITLSPPPARLGITHWSTRLLARELGVSRDTLARVWREYGVQPWRVATFMFSTDPQLAAKVHDVVGLSLHPPERGWLGEGLAR
ncbi:MAG: family transposase [Actinomycetia bacterium]|nr:family transposase [Actinomycetes bacterium]